MSKPKDDDAMTGHDVWFVSEPFGFTAAQSHAKLDAEGVPIIAPGHWQGIVRRASKERAAAIVDGLMDEVWEHYLDLQERTFELVERKEEMEHRSHLQSEIDNLRKDLDTNGAQKQGVAEAIALIEYTHLWKTDPEEAMAKVISEARARYDASVGEE